MGEERRERLPAVLLRVDFPTAALAKAIAGRGEPEKIRLCLFSLRSNRIPIPRLLLLSVLVSVNFSLQSQGSKLTFLLGSTGAPNFKKLGAP